MKFFKVLLGAIALSFVAITPAVATIDVTSVTAALADGQAGVGLIGAAMLLFLAAGIGYKWLMAFMI